MYITFVCDVTDYEYVIDPKHRYRSGIEKSAGLTIYEGLLIKGLIRV